MSGLSKKNKQRAALRPSLLSWAGALALFITFSTCSKEPPLRIILEENDSNYRQTVKLLEETLTNAGYEVELIPSRTAIEGAKLVANGEADFSLIMDQTDLEPLLGQDIYRLRTIIPLFKRVVYILYAPYINDEENFFALAKDRKVYAGVEGGEKYNSFLRFTAYAGFSDFKITTDSLAADIIFFWGDTNAGQADEMLRRGWKVFGLNDLSRQALSMRLGKLSPIDLPPTPYMPQDKPIRTISSNVLLLTSDRIEEQEIYVFTQALFAARPRMAAKNPIYEQMREDFDILDVPYPIHAGVEAYLRRDEPTFWERYAEVIGLGIAILATISGVVQSVRLWIHRRRKERLDTYLIRFAEIKRNSSEEKKKRQLEDILQEALDQLTRERLEKEDFDILARLVYAELSTF